MNNDMEITPADERNAAQRACERRIEILRARIAQAERAGRAAHPADVRLLAQQEGRVW